MVDFPPLYFHRETTFLTSCLLFCAHNPFIKGATSFHLEESPIDIQDKTILTSLLCKLTYGSHLILYFYINFNSIMGSNAMLHFMKRNIQGCIQSNIISSIASLKGQTCTAIEDWLFWCTVAHRHSCIKSSFSDLNFSCKSVAFNLEIFDSCLVGMQCN